MDRTLKNFTVSSDIPGQCDTFEPAFHPHEHGKHYCNVSFETTQVHVQPVVNYPSATYVLVGHFNPVKPHHHPPFLLILDVPLPRARLRFFVLIVPPRSNQ